MSILFWMVVVFLVPTLFFSAFVAKFQENGRRFPTVLAVLLMVLVVALLLMLGRSGDIW